MFGRNRRKEQDALDILNQQFEDMQRIARGDCSSERSGSTNTEEYLVAAIVWGVREPDDRYCLRAMNEDPLWQMRKAGRVKIHPMEGWNKQIPDEEMIDKLAENVSHSLREGLRTKGVRYEIRRRDEECLVITFYGGDFWKQLMSIEAME